MANNVVRSQYNLQSRHGDPTNNIYSTVEIASTADFLVHFFGTNNAPNPDWLGIVDVSFPVSPPVLHPFDLSFRVPTNYGTQYLGCVGGNKGETMVISGIVIFDQPDGSPQYQPMILTLTVVSDGDINVTAQSS